MADDVTTKAAVIEWLARATDGDRAEVLRPYRPAAAKWRGEFGETKRNHDYAHAMIVYWDLTCCQNKTHAEAIILAVDSRPDLKNRYAQFESIVTGSAKRADIYRLALLIRDGPKN